MLIQFLFLFFSSVVPVETRDQDDDRAVTHPRDFHYFYFCVNNYVEICIIYVFVGRQKMRVNKQRSYEALLW